MPSLVTQKARVSSWRRLDLSYESAFMNLALEEALALNTFSEGTQLLPTVRFWVNPRAVVIGRFQEASSEVDIARCKLSDVQVARRFTGGGAVFHDEGTLNFTIISKPSERPSVSEFQDQNLRLVLQAFDSLGLSGSI
jgi:lipoate-protein ligase A